MTTRKRFLAVTGSLMALALLIGPTGQVYGQVDERTQAEPGQEKPAPAVTARQKSLLNEISNAIHTVAASAEQSVVHIEVIEGTKSQEKSGRSDRNKGDDQDQGDSADKRPSPHNFDQLPPDIQDQLRRFFGGQVPKFFEQPGPSEPMPRRGLGSGIIYDNEGHILTNNHVVQGATNIRVKTTTGRSLVAEVVGTDPLTDVAVIKVKEDGLKPAQFGNSSKMRIGDLVLALGNPFGLDYSVTLGIISAKGRSGLQLGNIYYQNFLQTDAAINPGNSGGPLVNMNGQVIGMSTAIATQTGQYAGVGFAIPIDMARKIANILIAKGKVTRGWLGVSIQNLKPGMAQSFNFPEGKEGVLVEDVKPDSPAADAGFEAGDIIMGIDGKPVRNAIQLQTAVTLTAPGTEVTFNVWRDGKEMKLKTKLGELKESYLRSLTGEEEEGPSGAPRRHTSEELGITYVTPTKDLAKQYNWSRTPEGAMVVKVSPAGEAANLMIRPGDVIESVNNEKISSASDLRDALEKVSKEEGFRMYVRGPRLGGRYVYVQRQ